MESQNPFYNVGPVDNEKFFFNRNNLIETITSSVFADRPQCISIVGQRKIGKSSLVQHIFRASTLGGVGINKSNYLPIFFNCQTHTNRRTNRESFFRSLIDEIQRQIPSNVYPLTKGIIHASNSYSDWVNLINVFEKRDYKLIFVFDEFDKAVLQTELIKDGVFGNLRGWANDTTCFKWITCTSQYLHTLFTEAFEDLEISSAKRKSESDFYNIAPTNIVGLFNIYDTSKLIKSPLEDYKFEFSKEETALILKCGGNFPYFVQRACFHTFNSRTYNNGELKEIKRLFLQEATPIWENYWTQLEHSYQQVLFNIASELLVPSARIVNHLIEMALIDTDTNGHLLPFSDEFRDFVLIRGEKIFPNRIVQKPTQSSSLKSNKKKKSNANSKADILLVGVTKVEMKAILNSFGKQINRRIINKKLYYDLGRINDAQVFLVQTTSLGSTGLGGSLFTVNKAIEDLSPSSIIMVGVAFGVDSENQDIGDILISERLLSYEAQRIGTRNGEIVILPRGNRVEASPRLLDRFKSGELDWHGPNIKFGLILSGEKLVDNIQFRNQIIEIEPEAIGGEMEGAGLFTAAQNHNIDWIIVKAICDWADGHKNENKRESQIIASRNAVQFTLHVINIAKWT